jgi:hypothetical protein
VLFVRSPNKQSIFEYSQLIGIEANCVASGFIGQFEFVIHGDSAGKVFRQERGTSFDGMKSLAYIKHLTSICKTLRYVRHVYKVNTFLKSEGNTEVFVGVSYDYDDIYTLNPASYNFYCRSCCMFRYSYL